MHKPESVLEINTHKILLYFMIHSILARTPNLVLINKKKITCYEEDFAIKEHHRIEIKESEKIDLDQTMFKIVG